MSWDPYLDLNTGALRNLLGITDRAELARAEADLTASRIYDLSQARLPGDYDLAHLQLFHREIFRDVYDWAGQLRTVRLGRGAVFCPPEQLATAADEVFTRLSGTDHLRGMGRAAFVDALTELLADLNFLHPFREGNGRTQRCFLAQLSRDAGYAIRFVEMDPATNTAACRAAHLDNDTTALRAMLEQLVDYPEPERPPRPRTPTT